MTTPSRVTATAAALHLIDQLRAQHGPVMFVLSHGCCDGSTPMCLKHGEMQLGADDLHIADVGGVPFHVSRSQMDYLSGTQLILDAQPGSQGSFSLEDSLNQHFVARSRLWTDAEVQALEAGQALQTAPSNPP